MNPQVCPETSDEGPGQPVEACWPFHLPGGPPPTHPAPLKAALLKWGVFPALRLSLPLLLGGRSALLWTNQIPSQPQFQEVSQGLSVLDRQEAAAAAGVGKTRGRNHGRPTRPHLQPRAGAHAGPAPRSPGEVCVNGRREHTDLGLH